MNRYEVKFWDENGHLKRVQVNAAEYKRAEEMVSEITLPGNVQGSVLLVREVSAKEGLIKESVRYANEDD